MKNRILFGLLVCAALSITGCSTDSSGHTENLVQVPMTDFSGLLPSPLVQVTLPAIVETDRFIGTVTWYHSADGYFWSVPLVNTFYADMSYRASIHLIPKSGWTFCDLDADNFIHQGGAVTGFHTDGDEGFLVISFPLFAPADTEVIPDTDLTGVIFQPARDGMPQSAITGNGFTGTITWETTDGEPFTESFFQASTAYRAIAVLTPDTGFTLIGLGRNDFTHSAAQSIVFDYEGSINYNSLRSAIVYLEFAATAGPDERNPITRLDLTALIPSPVLRAQPVTAFTGDQYNGSVAWFNYDTDDPLGDEFPYGLTIGANVTLTRVGDFIFDDVDSDSFTHQDSMQITNEPGSSVNQESITVLIAFNSLEWTARRLIYPRLAGKAIQACCWHNASRHPSVLINLQTPGTSIPDPNSNLWDWSWSGNYNTSWSSSFPNNAFQAQSEHGHPVVFNSDDVPEAIRKPAHVFTINMGEDGRNIVKFGMYPRQVNEGNASRWPTRVEIFYSNIPIPPIFNADPVDHDDPDADPDLHIISLGTIGENRRGIFWHDFDLIPHGTYETESNLGITAQYIHFRIYNIQNPNDLGASFSQIRIGVQE